MREFWYGFFGSIAGVLAAIALLGVAAVFLASTLVASLIQEGRIDAPLSSEAQSLMLEIDLRGSLLPDGPGPATGGVVQIVRALDAASRDPRVDSVFLSAGVTQGRNAHAEEIASALERFEASGRIVVAHIQDGERTGVAAYLAASAATQVWAAPLSGLSAPLSGDDVFNPFWLDPQAFELAAAHRGLGASDYDILLRSGLISADAARQAGLIDRVGHREEARAAALGDSTRTAATVADYLKATRRPEGRDQIALVSAVLPLQPIAAYAGLTLAPTPEALAAAVDAAAASPDVRAIIVRIDVEYGDYAAADQLAAAMRRARSGGVPVVTSVGSSAVGAGYLAAAAGDRIIAPATARLGGFGLSPTQPGFGSIRQAGLTNAIADARDLPEARINALGFDQAWSGREAVDLGLADSVGGLHEAIITARALAGLAPDDPAVLVDYPERSDRRATWLERLAQALAD